MNKFALVVGCAACIWDDVKRATTLHNFDAVYCVKQAGIYWPTKFDVWCSLHPEMMDKYEAERKAKGFPSGYEIVAPLSKEVGSHGQKGNIARRVSLFPKGVTSSPSSGIYAAYVAVQDGFHVVLAGIPMQTSAGHFLPGTRTIVLGHVRGPQWLERDAFLAGFEQYKPHLRGKVKSMSGETKNIFGEPTLGWLRGDPAPVNSAEAPA